MSSPTSKESTRHRRARIRAAGWSSSRREAGPHAGECPGMNSTMGQLIETLEEARTAGFLGPGPVEPHIRHAQGFAAAVVAALGREPANFADLGSGGGVPGLVLG